MKEKVFYIKIMLKDTTFGFIGVSLENSQQLPFDFPKFGKQNYYFIPYSNTLHNIFSYLSQEK
jgi:hypothetical protein